MQAQIILQKNLEKNNYGVPLRTLRDIMMITVQLYDDNCTMITVQLYDDNCTMITVHQNDDSNTAV